jgi:hypothetical protein
MRMHRLLPPLENDYSLYGSIDYSFLRTFLGKTG